VRQAEAAPEVQEEDEEAEEEPPPLPFSDAAPGAEGELPEKPPEDPQP